MCQIGHLAGRTIKDSVISPSTLVFQVVAADADVASLRTQLASQVFREKVRDKLNYHYGGPSFPIPPVSFLLVRGTLTGNHL